MNNFNKVFLVIKTKCEKQKNIAEINCFETICREANIPENKLPIYLAHLQDIGLIRYSIPEKFIHLTSLGKKQVELISE